MARPCRTCTSPSRLEIEAKMLAGTRMDDLARSFKISRAALYSHKNRCLSANLLSSLRAAEDVGAIDLLEALTEVLGDLAAARGSAMMTGRTSDVVRAASATTAVVSVLMDKIGLDSTEVIRELRDADDLARSVAAVVRDSPDLAAPIAAALRQRGQAEAAAALQAVADLARLTTERIEAIA
jgi:hypothetical protein